MNRQSPVDFLVRPLFVLFVLFSLPGTSGLSAFQLPAGSEGQIVTISGRLELAGQNYFLDPRFVIVDDQQNRIPVASWAPLELPPGPPGTASSGAQARTMRDYVNQRLIVAGVHRVASGNPGQLNLTAAPGASYIEVQSVNDFTSGALLFNASSTITRTNETSGAAPAPPTSIQPTGVQQPAADAASPTVTPQPAEAQRPATPAAPGTPH